MERHTRCVEIHDGGPSNSASAPTTPYTLGSGLAGQQFVRLEKAIIDVRNMNTTQGYAVDRAALQPLFGVTWLETALSRQGDGLLSDEHAWNLLQNFPNVRQLALPGIGTEPALPGLNRQQAAQLMQLESLMASSFWHPVPDGLFPHMTRLKLRDLNIDIRNLAAVFANVARACPVLALLTLHIDSDTEPECDSWWDRENYSVFAHAPPRLKAICLMLNCNMLPPIETASQFVALVQSRLPAGVGVHVSTYKMLDDDGVLPVAPWAPAPGPSLGASYDDAALARMTFTPWND